MDDLEEIRKKKLEELEKRYFRKEGNSMSQNWPDKPININDADLDVTVKKYTTVVVDCWAPWCGPCRMVGPMLEELAKEMQGKIAFAKLNVDENQATSMKYQIMSIPTMLIFKNGELVDKLIGALPKEALIQKLNQYQ